jgi:hypothetical protein
MAPPAVPSLEARIASNFGPAFGDGGVRDFLRIFRTPILSPIFVDDFHVAF